MEEKVVYLGMDVHKETIAFAVYAGEETDVTMQKVIANDKTKIKKELSKVAKLGKLSCCYEAGFCGYDLYRFITSLGHNCSIAAPSLIPIRAGDKVKTDKRDAKKIAVLLRAGLLTFVNVPDIDSERDRSLIRLRSQMKKDVIRVKHRILKFLQLRGLAYPGKTHWTIAHKSYLGSLEMHSTDQLILTDYLAHLSYLENRVNDIDQEIEKISDIPKYRQKISALKCFRGISTLSAMTLVTEIEDILRFKRPTDLMSYTGLTPSEHSSGQNIYRGAITKQGNKRLRHCFIEIAWHYVRNPIVGAALAKRLEGQDKEVVLMSLKSIKRLNKRFWSLTATKDRNKAVVAIARELSGFIWAALWHIELKRAA